MAQSSSKCSLLGYKVIVLVEAPSGAKMLASKTKPNLIALERSCCSIDLWRRHQAYVLLLYTLSWFLAPLLDTYLYQAISLKIGSKGARWEMGSSIQIRKAVTERIKERGRKWASNERKRPKTTALIWFWNEIPMNPTKPRYCSMGNALEAVEDGADCISWQLLKPFLFSKPPLTSWQTSLP